MVDNNFKAKPYKQQRQTIQSLTHGGSPVIKIQGNTHDTRSMPRRANDTFQRASKMKRYVKR